MLPPLESKESQGLSLFLLYLQPLLPWLLLSSAESSCKMTCLPGCKLPEAQGVRAGTVPRAPCREQEWGFLPQSRAPALHLLRPGMEKEVPGMERGRDEM